MPQSLNQKAVNNFVRGLITEAGEMTFPDGASVDELNCDLRRDGTRRRRLAVEYESNNVLSTFTLADNEFVSIGEWVNVGGNADLEYLVLQKGATLYFYNKGSLPYSGQIQTGSIDLTTYEHAGSNGSETAKCQYASLKGTLVVSSPEINTIAIEYDSVSNTFSVTQISFEVRDFEWQGDTTTYYSDEPSPSQDRKYDAQNTGWNTGNGSPTDLTKRLTHPWYSGKNSAGAYDATEFNQIYGGTTLTGNGHYVLDFFAKNRGSVSGLTGLTKMTDPESSRFRCVESFAGRVFYSGLESAQNAGTILFSKLVDTIDDLGICHQQNDPTSEHLPDLFDTDGGEIKIPDAVKIQKLYAFQNSLFVFAENGIWQISGVDGIFKASAYSVNRVSRIGLLTPESFVAAEGVPFWWSRFGIHTLQTDPVSGQGTEQNLTLPTIQSYWDGIESAAKLKVVSTYDSINKRIFWAYPNDGEEVESKLNNFLILDVPLQAFYPWKISDQSTNTSCVVGLSFYSSYGASPLELDVTSNSGVNDVLVSTGVDVNAGSFVVDDIYQIKTLGTTDFTAIGAATNTVGEIFVATDVGSSTVAVSAGSFVVGVDYTISSVGTTDFTLIGAASNTVGVSFTATGDGVEDITAGSFVIGETYTIKTVGTTDFTLIGSADNNIGTTFVATGVGTGDGVATFTGSGEATPDLSTGVATKMDDVVSTQISTLTTGDPAIVLICRNGADNKITFGGFTSISFKDWGDADYSSYAETGYDFIGDLILKKSAPYIVTYCRLTETGFTGNEDIGYDAVRESSLLVSSAWDFNEEFGTNQQAYRKKFPVVVDPNNLSVYDYPESVITSRLKLRGTGRSVRIKYESETGKDFLLIGWGVIQGRNPRY
jgi:hypothetical protein